MKNWKTLNDLKRELKEKNDYDPTIEQFFIEDGIGEGNFYMKRDVSGEYFIEGSLSIKMRTSGKVEKEQVKSAYNLFIKSLKGESPAGGVVGVQADV